MPKPENIEPHKWKKGQSGNPKGRPKKSFGMINDKLKDAGYAPLKKAELMEAYSLVFNMDQKGLMELAADEETPYSLRVIILELNDKKNRFKAIQDYRDYVFGRAKENSEIVINERPFFPNIDKDDPNE